jgi:hypothetical protein
VSFAPRPTVKLIKRVIKGQAETKFRSYFQGATTDPTNVTLGQYADRTFFSKNQYILSNTTDIHRLIPIIQQGVGDNQRVGTRIEPTRLTVSGNVQVNKAKLLNFTPQERFVVIYVLQHVTLKSYPALVASNNFAALLDTGDQQTAAFNGDVQSLYLPVAKQNYRLLAKRVIPLRQAGYFNTGTSTAVSVANSHNYSANFRFNLTKHLPKHIAYPEGSGVPDPTNTSIFMCVAWADMIWDVTTPPPASTLGVDMTYVSQLHFKDI